MAINKSAIKRSRQAEKSNKRNSSVKSSVRTAVKTVLSVVDGKDKEQSLAVLARAIPALDKAAAKGVFHKKTISRKISRLTKKVNALQ
ncbi:MAG: 30S ribosomal protein S20 [Smithellaceae bacterium]|nr:30S ribosomal protein S20 [Smithellaceae bacterium]